MHTRGATEINTLSSMTGFARQSGDWRDLHWIWEVKSVNGKALDLRLKLPGGCDAIEADCRARLAGQIQRGNVSANLQIVRQGSSVQYRINPAVLAEFLTMSEQLVGEGHATSPTADGLLSLPGVIERAEQVEDEADLAARDAMLVDGFAQAVAGLVEMRRQEGARLAALLAGQLAEIGRLTGEAEASAATQPEAIRARLRAQLEEILRLSPPVAEDRLAVEIALLATRIDVREELDRLSGHVTAARDTLASGQPAGRRLDFLAQEFNREANTLCSKAQDPALKRIGLELKLVIDQFREQVQNVE